MALGTFLVALAFAYGPGTLRMSLPASLAVAGASAGSAWLSLRRPGAALLTVTALSVALPLIRSTFDAFDLVVVLVLFQAAMATTLPAWLLGGVGLVDLTVNDLWLRAAFDRPAMEPSVLYPLLLTALAVGLGLQSRRVRLQHVDLVRLREADLQRAICDERRTIARDLHDVAAHHLSALVVRNTLARRIGTGEALQRASDFTAATAAETLQALRAVVRVLDTQTASPLHPQPRLDDLAEVLTRMTAAGLEISRAPGVTVVARREVEVAIVRISQEALANVLRHRGPGRCWVALLDAGGEVVLTIEDDGPCSDRDPAAVQRSDTGFGLVGMRERARSCGGRLTVDRSPRGGWRVTARFPTASGPGSQDAWAPRRADDPAAR